MPRASGESVSICTSVGRPGLLECQMLFTSVEAGATDTLARSLQLEGRFLGWHCPRLGGFHMTLHMVLLATELTTTIINFHRPPYLLK